MIRKVMTAIKKGTGIGYNLYINNKDIKDLNMEDKHDNINQDNIKDHKQDLTVIINSPNEYESLKNQDNEINKEYKILQEKYDELKNKFNQNKEQINNLNGEITTLKETLKNNTITINNTNKEIVKLETLTKTKDVEIKDYKLAIKDLQKEKEVNIHIISVLYERLSHISSSSIWDRLRNKTKKEANKTIDTIKPKIVELLNKGSEE
jgi:chromosome segregation ATPase